jgi:uncharacterized Zn finger protein
MECSCPDWEVPCEHHAAAFYLLAEAFDDDPFTILAWRGREREDLLANLHAGRSDGPPAVDHAEQTGPPLADRFDSYFVIQAELPTTSPALSFQHLPARSVAPGWSSLCAGGRRPNCCDPPT